MQALPVVEYLYPLCFVRFSATRNRPFKSVTFGMFFLATKPCSTSFPTAYEGDTRVILCSQTCRMSQTQAAAVHSLASAVFRTGRQRIRLPKFIQRREPEKKRRLHCFVYVESRLQISSQPLLSTPETKASRGLFRRHKARL